MIVILVEISALALCISIEHFRMRLSLVLDLDKHTGFVVVQAYMGIGNVYIMFCNRNY